MKTLDREGAPLAAIKWALKNESVDTAIVCMTDQDQLDENLRAMAEPYTDKDEKLLNQQLAYIGPMYCRMCGACGGVCDKGVPVPDMLRFLTYAEGYGQFALAREKFLELPARVRDIRCSDCGVCSVDCPTACRCATGCCALRNCWPETAAARLAGQDQQRDSEQISQLHMDDLRPHEGRQRRNVHNAQVATSRKHDVWRSDRLWSANRLRLGFGWVSAIAWPIAWVYTNQTPESQMGKPGLQEPGG